MPSIFTIGSYRVFWSNENGEPIHVHIAEGSPKPNATNVWLTKAGGCIVANNASGIPDRDLRKILLVISAQHGYICKKWQEFFKVDTVDFYC